MLYRTDGSAYHVVTPEILELEEIPELPRILDTSLALYALREDRIFADRNGVANETARLNGLSMVLENCIRSELLEIEEGYPKIGNIIPFRISGIYIGSILGSVKRFEEQTESSVKIMKLIDFPPSSLRFRSALGLAASQFRHAHFEVSED